MFNTDLLNIKPSSGEDFHDSILQKLHSILRHSFPTSKERQRIKIAHNRFQFACPICGDSAHDVRKKRGNIILKGNFENTFKCFNCGAFMDVGRFFGSFAEADPSVMLTANELEFINTSKTNFSKYKESIDYSIAGLLLEDSIIEKYCPSIDNFIQHTEFTRIKEGSAAYNYLRGRAHYDHRNFLERGNEIAILNIKGDLIYGMQTRSISGDRVFSTYKLSEILKRFLKIYHVEVPEELDALSTFYNILSVNMNRPIIVTEGPMDSFLIKNSMSLSGSTKHPPIELNYLYMYDDDEPGKKQALSVLNHGHPVFLWARFKKDLGLPRRKKWDYNDVLLYCRERNIRMPNLYDYFSDDPFDALDV